MADLIGGINGGFRGKVGSVVGYYMYGKWVLRGLPKPSKKRKKGTPRQRVARARFTTMQYFLSPILGFTRVGFNLESKIRNNSAYNAAKSYNMRNAMDEEGAVVLENVRVSYGNLAGAVEAKVQSDDIGLHFSWKDNTHYTGGYHAVPANRDDQVMLLAYDLEKGDVHMLTSGARRNVGKETLAIPDFFKGREMHVWIAFIADNREQIATSTYLGSIVY